MAENDVAERVRQIKTGIEAARVRRARAEVVRDTATGAAQRARERLVAEFGVSTPEEAKAVLARLDSELDTAIREAQEALERTDG